MQVSIESLVTTFEKKVEEGINAFKNNAFLEYQETLSQISGCLSQVIALDQKLALELEIKFYNKVVKLFEKEESYHIAFANHSKAFYDAAKGDFGLGRYEADQNSFIFVFHNSSLLGHSEVFLFLAGYIAKKLTVRVFFLAASEDKRFKERLIAKNIEYFECRSLDLYESLFALRGYCFRMGIFNLVWVSTAPTASYALGLNLAQRMFFWSLKFHPIYFGQDIKHIGLPKIGSGDFDDTNQNIMFKNNRPWYAFRAPLVGAVKPVPEDIATREKIKISEKFIFGTIARDEKYTEEFVKTISEILQQCPESIYLWTGKNKNNSIFDKYLASYQDRVKFIGWVDSSVFPQFFDVFLETFPFGCGVSGWQALYLGTRFNSLWDRNTLPHFYFRDKGEAKSYIPTWRVAFSLENYKKNAIDAYQGKWKRSEYIDLSDIQNHLNKLNENKSQEFLDLLSKDK